MSKSQNTFDQLLKENKHKIYRICRIYAATPIEPQDLFQEVIFQIWKSLPNFKGNSSINTWVYRITLNVCLRTKTNLDKSNNKTTRLDAIHFTPVTETVEPLELEKFKYLKECIATLNESDTSIIVMYLDELSYKEMAEIIGLSENHIAVKMKRIRKKLFECITPKLN
ncbi:RNA polymerase sigma factor [Lacinutrix jangbogonensis]|uniref:RNA polymerase sigma factor n=1 Tax=Lacinutrix jangbogonensis TaxID=1469557 RepID=UPI00053E4BCA|nr:sigma-70 family RNA polymerase sigma factor [Lacinutrix jangbogonensis]